MTIVKEGHLQLPHTPRLKTRYFVLDDQGTFSVYRKKGGKIRATIRVSGSQVAVSDKASNTIQIGLENALLTLIARNEEQREDWVNALVKQGLHLVEKVEHSGEEFSLNEGEGGDSSDDEQESSANADNSKRVVIMEPSQSNSGISIERTESQSKVETKNKDRESKGRSRSESKMMAALRGLFSGSRNSVQPPDDSSYDHVIKLIVIGDSGVGKTTLMDLYVNKQVKAHQSTIGVDVLIKEEILDDKKIKIQIYDTAGQEKYHSLGTTYYRDCNACIVMFDVSNMQSFTNLQRWIDEYLERVDSEDYNLVVIGNKIDLEYERLISSDSAMKWCNNQILPGDKKIGYFETSATQSINVELAIQNIIKNAYSTLVSKDLSRKSVLDKRVSMEFRNQRNLQQQKKSGCC